MNKAIYFREEDVAAILKVSRSASRGIMLSNGFPVIRIGKMVFTSKENFERWVNEYWIDTALTPLSLRK